LGCFFVSGFNLGFSRGAKGRRKAGKGVKRRGMVENGVVWLEKRCWFNVLGGFFPFQEGG
jgi:hypothetical protein